MYVPADRGTHGGPERTLVPTRAPKSPVAARMRDKLATVAGRTLYALRKSPVEPVFGQIKEARQFRRFALRVVIKVWGEWRLICLRKIC